MYSFKMILFMTMFFSTYGHLTNFVSIYKKQTLELKNKQKNRNITFSVKKVNIPNYIKNNILFINSCNKCNKFYETYQIYEIYERYKHDLFIPFLLFS
jgi:hypothetical protein